MARLTSTFIALSLCALAPISHCASTWTPGRFATVNAYPNGVITYFPLNGTIQQIGAISTPSNPSAYNVWNNGGPMVQYGVTNVAQESDIAGIGYLSPQTGALVQRLFYQATNGDIRSAYHSGLQGAPGFVIDSTVIASGVALGTPLSAMQQAASGLGVPQGIIVQWTDANGLLNSRFATADNSGWSPSIVISTP